MNEKERVQSLLKENGLVAKKSFGQKNCQRDGGGEIPLCY